MKCQNQAKQEESSEVLNQQKRPPLQDQTVRKEADQERWLPVWGYRGRYEASSIGRVRSVTHIDKYGKKRTGKVLMPARTPKGYLVIVLSKDGVKKMFFVHQVIMLAFLHLEINHIDGNKTNNRISNLEWLTRADNNKHAYRIGLMKPAGKGKCWARKLTDEQVLAIFANKGIKSRRSLAKEYGVHPSTITSIFYKKTYQGVLCAKNDQECMA